MKVVMIGAAWASMFVEERPDHWLVLHIGKTAGASLRSALKDMTHAAGWSMQAHYRIGRPWSGLPAFNQKTPARIIMGHALAYPNAVHDQLPPGSTYAYATVFREPLSWMVSLYFFLNPLDQHKPDATRRLLDWVGDELDKCPCVLRNREKESTCEGQFAYWLAPTNANQCELPDLSCADIADAWNDVNLVLLTERFDDSLRLLADALDLPNNATPTGDYMVHDNHIAYDQTLTFADLKRLTSFLETTCLRDVYVAGRLRFEADIRDLDRRGGGRRRHRRHHQHPAPPPQQQSRRVLPQQDYYY